MGSGMCEIKKNYMLTGLWVCLVCIFHAPVCIFYQPPILHAFSDWIWLVRRWVLFSYSRWEFRKPLSMFQEDVKLHKKVESRNERNTTKLGHQPHHVTGGQGHQESGQGHSDERRETARASERKSWGYAVVVRGRHCFIFNLNRPQQMYKCSLMWNSNVHWTFGQLHVVHWLWKTVHLSYLTKN